MLDRSHVKSLSSSTKLGNTSYRVHIFWEERLLALQFCRRRREQVDRLHEHAQSRRYFVRALRVLGHDHDRTSPDLLVRRNASPASGGGPLVSQPTISQKGTAFEMQGWSELCWPRGLGVLALKCLGFGCSRRHAPPPPTWTLPPGCVRVVGCILRGLGDLSLGVEQRIRKLTNSGLFPLFQEFGRLINSLAGMRLVPVEILSKVVVVTFFFIIVVIGVVVLRMTLIGELYGLCAVAVFSSKLLLWCTRWRWLTFGSHGHGTT